MGEGEDKRIPLCRSSRRSEEVRLDKTDAKRGSRRDFVILKRKKEKSVFLSFREGTEPESK